MSDIKTWTTYRMADGTPIWGDYAWVDTPEMFEDIDEPVSIVKETWALQDSETVTFSPSWWDDEDWSAWYGEEE